MTLQAHIEACVVEGVTERPPEAGIRYYAFVVRPHSPGPLCALAIAHLRGRTSVVALVREDITVTDSVPILDRYGISQVVGAEIAHAVMGALALTRERLHDA